MLVGVRAPLIALNVWLPDGTLTEARAIAARVREAGGGLPGVRAMGLYLPEAGMAQVSMNIEDRRAAPPAAVIRAVRAEAERLGIEAGDAELVGLIPADALRGGPSPAALRHRRVLARPDRRPPDADPPGDRLMAKRKRRKSAGPPPVPVPKKAAADGGHGLGDPRRSSASPASPCPPPCAGVLIRAGIVAAIFYPYLVYVIDEDPWTALGLTADRLRPHGAPGPVPRPPPLPPPDAPVGGEAGAAASRRIVEPGRSPRGGAAGDA